MSVELAPSGQLGFHRPLTMLVKRTLSVRNPNSQPVAFKVKTTAPKQYCVRPNSGRIEPGERVEVQVLLQPMKEEPPTGAKCRDKFLVQSTLITPAREPGGVTEIWAAVEAEAKAGREGAIHEQKIRCAWLPQIEEHSQANGSPSAPTTSVMTNGSPVQQFDTVKSHPGDESTYNDAAADKSMTNSRIDSPGPPSYGAAASGSVVPTILEPKSATEAVAAAIPSGEQIRSAANNAASSVAAAASSAAASVGLTNAASASSTTVATALRPASDGDTTQLQQDLREARAEIDRLKAALSKAQRDSESSGLRQRSNIPGVADRNDKSSHIAGGGIAVAAQEGIPLQMVGALVAATFLFTWLFL